MFGSHPTLVSTPRPGINARQFDLGSVGLMRLSGVPPQVRVAARHANISACVDASKIFSFITELKKWIQNGNSSGLLSRCNTQILNLELVDRKSVV